VGAEVLADLALEGNFVVEANRLKSWAMATFQRRSLGKLWATRP
jgi:hypothetical protein